MKPVIRAEGVGKQFRIGARQAAYSTLRESLMDAARAPFNRLRRPAGGDGDTVWANGTIASLGVEAAYGAIARYAYDVGAWDTGSWLVFHGASGHPGSPHYADQVPLWGRGALIPALYAWPRIEALARKKQVLKP